MWSVRWGGTWGGMWGGTNFEKSLWVFYVSYCSFSKYRTAELKIANSSHIIEKLENTIIQLNAELLFNNKHSLEYQKENSQTLRDPECGKTSQH